MIDKIMLDTALYEIYREDWMSRNVNPAERAEKFARYKLEVACEDYEGSFDDYLWDNNGFGEGSLYVCFEEFMDAEYQDRECVKDLLDLADINEKQKEAIMESYDFYQKEEEDKEKDL